MTQNKQEKWENPYSPGEDFLNSLTHGIGAGLSVVGLILLVVLAALQGDVWRIIAFTVYGFSLIVLFVASTLYHSFSNLRVKRVLQKVDHAAVYILIAGTYTPFLLISLRSDGGWPILGIIWGLALLGILFKAFFINRYEVVATIAYVLMGWMCLLMWRQMVTNVPTGGIVWLIAGGIVYTTGVIFYAWQKLPYNHAIWHIFVLGGSLCHFISVFHLVPIS